MNSVHKYVTSTLFDDMNILYYLSDIVWLKKNILGQEHHNFFQYKIRFSLGNDLMSHGELTIIDLQLLSLTRVKDELLRCPAGPVPRVLNSPRKT